MTAVLSLLACPPRTGLISYDLSALVRRGFDGDLFTGQDCLQSILGGATLQLFKRGRKVTRSLESPRCHCLSNMKPAEWRSLSMLVLVLVVARRLRAGHIGATGQRLARHERLVAIRRQDADDRMKTFRSHVPHVLQTADALE